MSSVTVQEAQARLGELIDRVRAGDEVVITQDARPVARLTAPVGAALAPRRLGSMKGTVSYIAPDFDAPLDDFREYVG